jgi:flagellar hook-basal body complex protein FliE
MDPLSSLHFAVSPELRAARTPKTGEAGGSRAIPAAELEKLGGATQTNGTSSTSSAPETFESTLGQLVSEVNGKQVAANQAVTGLMSGQNVSLHQAMITMEEASVSFQLMVEVRNKLLESYQELMRMQV